MGKTVKVDAHHHFWKISRGDYHWLESEPESIRCDFLPQHLKPLLERAGIDRTILVQAAETEAETQYILELAAANEFIVGVVGWLDMEAPGRIEVLESWAKHPKFLGIRPIIQGIPDPDWMLKPELDPVFQWLIDNDFSFDALVLPVHLSNLLTLVDRYPTLRVVIDHGAKPYIADAVMQPWMDDMAALASRPQVFCKLSGLVTEAGSRVNFDALQPYMQHLLSCFGAERLMWGSDWPVCTIAASYHAWVEMSHRFVESLSEDQRRDILGHTALRFYAPKALA